MNDDVELENNIYAIEESLWSADGDIAIFSKYLSSHFKHISSFDDKYYGKAAFLKEVAKAPKWKSVVMVDHDFLILAPDLVLLTYKIGAEYETGGVYPVNVTTIYKKESDDWKIILHHHAPNEEFLSMDDSKKKQVSGFE